MSKRSWDSGDRPRVSALVTTFNEERHIQECLDSLTWCDEILVVDSFSTDRTPEIVQAFDGARFLQREYYGAAAQKNWGMNHLEHEWILVFDADERCTPELAREIQALLLGEPAADAYTIHRKVFLLGRRIRFSGWQNDRVVRLFRKGTARYQNRRVHPNVMTTGPAPVLRNSMLHYMSDDFHDYMKRIVKYSYWGAAQAYRDGKRHGVNEVLGRPLFRFFRTYVLQLGFLDGMLGLVFCLLQSAGAYIKWATLWGWRVNEARGIPPNLPDFDETEETWRGLDHLTVEGR